MQGKAIIISAPSGAGKTTIVKHLLDEIPVLEFSVSACSRAPREGETNGKDYYFIPAGEFHMRIENCDFLEWEEVYPGCFYGTLKSEIRRIWSMNKVPIFDVDVKGALSLRNYFRSNGLSVFICPPSLDSLLLRLRERKTENAESLQKRISKAEYEMSFEKKFDACVINDDLANAKRTAANLVNDFLK